MRRCPGCWRSKRSCSPLFVAIILFGPRCERRGRLARHRRRIIRRERDGRAKRAGAALDERHSADQRHDRQHDAARHRADRHHHGAAPLRPQQPRRGGRSAQYQAVRDQLLVVLSVAVGFLVGAAAGAIAFVDDRHQRRAARGRDCRRAGAVGAVSARTRRSARPFGRSGARLCSLLRCTRCLSICMKAAAFARLERRQDQPLRGATAGSMSLIMRLARPR